MRPWSASAQPPKTNAAMPACSSAARTERRSGKLLDTIVDSAPQHGRPAWGKGSGAARRARAVFTSPSAGTRRPCLPVRIVVGAVPAFSPQSDDSRR